MDILQDIYAGAVIAAGGMAQRMQGINKQSLMIQGVPVLVRSIQRMAGGKTNPSDCCGGKTGTVFTAQTMEDRILPA